MIRTILVDDEPWALKNLSLMLKPYESDIEIVAKAKNVKEAVDLIFDHRPQLVFLDIELNSESSFDILERFPNSTFEIIFVTAHQDYGIKALKKGAIDYILKPIDKIELRQAIQKVLSLFEERTKENNASQSLINAKISLPTSDGLIFISPDDIIYCESDGRYTFFYVNRKAGVDRILISKNLGSFESILPQKDFVRIHHSHMINLAHVDLYSRNAGGTVIMSNGDELSISKRRKEDFLKRLS